MLLSSFLWFLGTLILLVLVQRWVHQHLHGVAYLISGQADMALMLYSLPLLPGVALHELSHATMAALLGVKTANLTLIPQRQPDGHVRLGSVQVERVDVVRSSLIGLAPLLAGSAAILLIIRFAFDVNTLGDAVQRVIWRHCWLAGRIAARAGCVAVAVFVVLDCQCDDAQPVRSGDVAARDSLHPVVVVAGGRVWLELGN